MNIGGKKSGNGKPNSKRTIPLKVTGFVEAEDGQVGVKGMDLVTGEEATIFLTTQGKFAEMPNRPSIEKLRDGYKVKKDFYRLEPGGIVSIRGCFPHNGGFTGLYPNVYAHNETGSPHVQFGDHITMVMRSNEETGKVWGDVYKYEEGHILAAKSISDVEGALSGYAEQIPNISLLVRYLDKNGDVVGPKGFSWVNRWDVKQEDGTYRNMTPQEFMETVRAKVAERQKTYAEQGTPVTLSILPGKRFAVSPKQLRESESSERAFFGQSYNFSSPPKEDGSKDMYFKQAVFLTGGDDDIYVNRIECVDLSDGVNPLTVGNLRMAEANAVAQQEDVHEEEMPDPHGEAADDEYLSAGMAAIAADEGSTGPSMM